MNKPTQQLLPFPDESRPQPRTRPLASSAPYQPSEEALAAINRLEDWLLEPRTRKSTPLAEEVLFAVRKALLEGKNGYWHRAEDLLEALVLRNGRTQGEDIPPGPVPEGEDFLATVQELLGCLHERLSGKGPVRQGGRS
jgi:hypothetical protein